MTRSCCLAGVTAVQLNRSMKKAESILRLREQIRLELERAAEAGYRRFTCGVHTGAEQIMCEELFALRERKPELSLRLVAVLTHRAQSAYRPALRRKRDEILSLCDEVFFAADRYAEGCETARDAVLLGGCTRCIAVYRGENDHVKRILSYANEVNMDIFLILSY